MKQMQTRMKHIHFVGIGGCGMSGIADVMLAKGYSISGSDVKQNKTTEYLKGRGVTIFIGHGADNINGADTVVLSSAIDDNNPEVTAAAKHNIPIIKRAQMLSEIMSEQVGIAIAGTHGKTTTTSLTTSIFLKGDMQPTYLIGGTLHESGVNASLGIGDHCIAEADESDASFLYLNPKVAVLTNIDVDHLWSYGSDFQNLKQTFIDFMNRLPADGVAVICADDPMNLSIMDAIGPPKITYGFAKSADVQILNFKQKKTQSSFKVKFKKEDEVLDIQSESAWQT